MYRLAGPPRSDRITKLLFGEYTTLLQWHRAVRENDIVHSLAISARANREQLSQGKQQKPTGRMIDF